MKKYIISQHSFYDSDRLLWRSDIGEGTIGGDLLYSVWGNSITKSRANAEKLVRALNLHQSLKQNNQKTAP